MACPGSADPPTLPYKPSDDASLIGQAVHKLLAGLVLGRVPDIASTATQHGADVDEVERLFCAGRRAWAALEDDMRYAHPEVQLRGRLCHGTADVISEHPDLVTIADWKTGRVERDHRHQLHGYASAHAHQWYEPFLGYELVIVWLEHGYLERWRISMDELRAWEKELENSLKNPHYAPGEACTFCPRSLNCPAREQYLHASVAALTDVSEGALTKERLVEMYPRVLLLEQAIDRYRTALREVVARGAVPLGRGKVMRLAERRRENIAADERTCMTLVDMGCDADEIERSKTLSKAALRRMAGPRYIEALQALRDAGCVEESAYTAIEVVKVNE